MFVVSIQPMFNKSYDEILFGDSLIIEIIFLGRFFWDFFLKFKPFKI